MRPEAWFTLLVAVGTIVLLALDRFPPALVMGGAVTLLLVVGVIDEADALAGFANNAPVTVAALYVLAGAADRTGAFERLVHRALGTSRGADTVRELARVAYPSAVASAFIANTPLVAMLAPRVLAWCRRTGRSPSRYLMPLSYAVIFGGCTTLVGTSTNLVVDGLLRQSGHRGFGLFEFTPVGVVIGFAGVTAIVLASHRLLPVRHAPIEDIGRAREFTFEMEIPVGSALAGRTVLEAGLRNLEGVFLVEVERHGRSVSPVGPDEVLATGDRLTFAGNIRRVLDLHALPGIVSAEEPHFAVAGASPQRQFYEAVVGDGSPLVGCTLKEVGFRSRYGAAVVAVHRAGERIETKLGEFRLRTGDVLLILSGADFRRRFREEHDFALVAPVDGAAPVRRDKARIVELATVALIVVAGTGLLDLLKTSLVVALALVALRVVTPREAGQSVDVEIILLMAASFGLGIAIDRSGLASHVADVVVRAFSPLGDRGVLAGILIATMLMTELLSNNAAAVLMFPVAMATAAQTGMQPRPFAVAILLGATLSFLTPIGYQANTLVWGIGGYRYADFARLGAPLTLLTAVVTLAVLPAVFPLR